MPLLDQLTKRVADQLPSVVSPKSHAIADYAAAAAFLGYGLFAWNRDRRAAVGSIGCAAFGLVTAVLTDYPGGLVRKISFESHGRIDIGLAGLVGTMPEYVGLKDRPAARFFRLQAVAIAAVTGLTDFSGRGERRQLRRIEEAA